MRYFITNILLTLVFCSSLFSNSEAIKVDNAIQTIIDSIRVENNITGIQFCFIDESDSLSCWSSGFADKKEKNQLSCTHTFRIGSTTKLFTSFIVMRMVQDSLISLNDKLFRWYPDFPYSKEISIRNLLMHTSGTVEILRFPKFLLECSFRPTKVYNVDELIGFVSAKSRKSARKPNRKYEYSNTNYIFLGSIAEKVLSKSFTELVQSLADEMHLISTSYVSPRTFTNNLVYGYDKDLIPFPWGYTAKPDNTAWTSLAAGSGGIISNSADLCFFLHEFINRHTFSKEIKAEILKFVPIEHEGMPAAKGIGLGVFKMEIDGNEYWGHEGQMIGSESLVLHCPKNNTTYCITGNRSAFKGKYEVITRISNEIQKIRRVE